MMLNRQLYQPIFNKHNTEDSKTSRYINNKIKEQCKAFDRITRKDEK